MCLLLLSTCTFGKPPTEILITDNNSDYPIEVNHMSLFIDSTGSLLVEDIAKKKFAPLKESSIRTHGNHNAYWLRIWVNDQTVTLNKWIFEVYAIYTDSITLYVPDKTGRYIGQESGSEFPFPLRKYQHINFVFDLPNHQNHQYPIYIKVVSDQQAVFSYFIRSQHFFTNRALNEYLFLGIYYGILLITAIYNLLIFITSREKTHLYYTIYVFCCIFLSLDEDGLGFQHIWPNHPSYNHILLTLTYPIFLISFIAYSSSFLELRKRLPTVFKTLLILTGGYLILDQINLLNGWLSDNLYLSPFVIVYISGIYLYTKGFKGARFFLLGFSLVLISIMITRLRWEGVIPHNVWTVYSFNFGILLEVIVLSYAIGDKFGLIKTEREIAQTETIVALEENKLLQSKVNRELEEKVAERTKELTKESEKVAEANSKLELLTAQLNDMNAKLDYDNWQLNKKVAAGKVARIKASEVPLDEFLSIYPNDDACLKHLEEIKWKDGFSCTKCHHENFTPKPKLARRCGKCSYLESVTTNTLFHGIKFPLNKAFYITYLAVHSKTTMTVDALAELLELRRNTCWNFRKRAQTRKEEFEKASGGKSAGNWEELILNNS